MPTIAGLTVAVLTHRRPRQLQSCLDSLRSQKYQPARLMVVDTCQKRLTIPEARNYALSRCRTPYLAFIDDDCVCAPGWAQTAYREITRHPDAAFIVGRTLLLNPGSYWARLQYQSYRQWFDHSPVLDTKNLILNLKKIRGVKFDPDFLIFEDIDFGLQLKSHGLTGRYQPKMTVSHPEVPGFIKAWRKHFRRGCFKNRLDRKWGNFDGYRPLPFTPKNLFTNPFGLAFSLGYLRRPLKYVVVVNNPLNDANGQRQAAFVSFLRSRHLSVISLDSGKLFFEALSSKKFLLVYGWPLIKFKILKILNDRYRFNLSSQFFFQNLYLRRRILDYHLSRLNIALAVIQYPEDMLTVLSSRKFPVLYDSPTIYFQELSDSQRYSPGLISRLRRLESAVFSRADYVSFHWYTYFKIAAALKLKISRPLRLDWGCPPSVSLPTKPPSGIVYLGKLNDYWVDPALLSRLCRLTAVDVYSYESPSSRLYPRPLKYRGFLADLKSLSRYRFGLVTLNHDDFRSRGFSAKYLAYISQGLPVLCPKWRRDPLLAPATVYYDEDNFSRTVKFYSDPRRWQQKHLAALRLARKLNWNTTLKPLLPLISKLL